MKIAIIGGGASGMMAAITAARAGASVTLYEHKDRVGKKILSTGNGKCNFTNYDMSAEKFRCADMGFVKTVLGQFSAADSVSFFEGLGMMVKERDGYLYPYTGQASTVLNLLRDELERLKADVRTSAEITKLNSIQTKNGSGYSVNGEYYDRVILACGSKAAPVTGSDGSGYKISENLGLKVNTPLPALVQLRCREKFYKSVSGVRTQAKITILVNGRETASDTGELQLTDYGISGIPVFQVSRYAAIALHQKKKTVALIDFYPDADVGEIKDILWSRKKLLGKADKSFGDFFEGWFPKKVADLFIKLSGIEPSVKVSSLSGAELETLRALIKSFRTVIESTNSFEQAQICCGGVDVSQINPQTMEVKGKKGLYIVGELLDVDGICGGYNLQWAWSTGFIAGKASSKINKDK